MSCLGIPVSPIPQDQLVGRTDRNVIHTYLTSVNCQVSPHLLAHCLVACEEISHKRLRQFPATLLPGVAGALETTQQLGFVNALLTGNTEGRARQKLASAGVSQYFDWRLSVFGSDFDERWQMTRHVVAETTSASASPEIPPVLLIVGDTPLDVQAAKSAALPVVAVASGGASAADLEATEADLVISNLDEDREAFGTFLRSLVSYY